MSAPSSATSHCTMGRCPPWQAHCRPMSLSTACACTARARAKSPLAHASSNSSSTASKMPHPPRFISKGEKPTHRRLTRPKPRGQPSALGAELGALLQGRGGGVRPKHTVKLLTGQTEAVSRLGVQRPHPHHPVVVLAQLDRGGVEPAAGVLVAGHCECGVWCARRRVW